MGAVTYPNADVVDLINKYFIPIRVAFDDKELSKSYHVKWTPTVILLDTEGGEHHRTVGFLSPEQFIPALILGLGKIYFDMDQFEMAISFLDQVVNAYPESDAAPEAFYLRGVSRYKSSDNAAELKTVNEELEQRYPESEWTRRSAPYRLL